MSAVEDKYKSKSLPTLVEKRKKISQSCERTTRDGKKEKEKWPWKEKKTYG